MSDSSGPHGLQPTRLLHPWDFPGKSTGVGCCCLLRTHTLSYLIHSGGSEDKEAACNARNLGSIPGLGRYPGEEDGNTLQYCCLENFMDRGAWKAAVHGVPKSRTYMSEQLHLMGKLYLQIKIFYNFQFYELESEIT